MCTIFFTSFLLRPCIPPSMLAFPNRSPFRLWRYWRAVWSLWTDTPHWDSALQRVQSPPFCVHRLRTVSLLISQRLVTSEQENRNANVTLGVRGKDCPAFCGLDARGVSEMCSYSRLKAIPGCSHSQRSQADPALGGCAQVRFWKTAWHSYNAMQMYALIQCQWLLRLPEQATRILIHQDYRLNNLEKNGLSQREQAMASVLQIRRQSV